MVTTVVMHELTQTSDSRPLFRLTAYFTDTYEKAPEDDVRSVPVLVATDTESGAPCVSVAQRKGADAYAMELMCRFIRTLGERKIVLQSDGEPSVLALRRAVEAWLRRALIA